MFGGIQTIPTNSGVTPPRQSGRRLYPPGGVPGEARNPSPMRVSPSYRSAAPSALLARSAALGCDEPSRHSFAIIRAGALKELREAQKRRDTRRQHEKAQKAVTATTDALRVGA